MIQEPMQKIVIIDDEPDAIAVIKGLVEMFCPGVEVASTALSALEGINVINQTRPDVVLLDVDMPGGNGFHLLETYNQRPFKVIFITASSDFAVQALRARADDYLLKPVNPLELKKALEKIKAASKKPATVPQKIALPEKSGYYYTMAADIIHIDGEGSYVTVYLKNGMKKLVSRNIKTFEEQLSGQGFLRCHQSHLVNLAEISQLKKEDGVFLIMSNGNKVAVSRAQKPVVLELLNG